MSSLHGSHHWHTCDVSGWTKQQESCGDWATPKTTYNLHGLVKLQLSCSRERCLIWCILGSWKVPLLPCFPKVCGSEVMSSMYIELAEKSRGSLLKNYKLKKKKGSSLVPGDLLPSWNQHPLTSTQAKAECVNACSFPAVQHPQGRRPDNTN